MRKIITSLFFAGLTCFGFTQDLQTEIDKAHTSAEKLATQLALSEEQKEKVTTIKEGIAQKNFGIRHHEKFSDEKKAEIIADNNRSEKRMIQEILSPEQNKKYIMKDFKREIIKVDRKEKATK